MNNAINMILIGGKNLTQNLILPQPQISRRARATTKTSAKSFYHNYDARKLKFFGRFRLLTRKAENLIRLIIKKLKLNIFMLCFVFFNVSPSLPLSLPAPPDISVEKTWIHAAESCDIQLACTLHGDVNSEVSS